jgi:hypothetical protein
LVVPYGISVAAIPWKSKAREWAVESLQVEVNVEETAIVLFWCYGMKRPFMSLVHGHFLTWFRFFFLLATNELNSKTATNSFKDMLTELKRTVHYLEQRLKREVKAKDLPQEKFGTFGNSGRYLSLLKLGPDFWEILDQDNVEEQRLSISNISEATKETNKFTIMHHIRNLANASQKIGKEPPR